MSLPDTLALRLIESVRAHDLHGRIAMLGRQRWVGTRKGVAARLFKAAIQTHLPGLSEDDLRNKDDPYSETFFRALGFAEVDSIDLSDFEGASIIHDLTQPLPEALCGAFDVLYDGGTCEHIFELPMAYANIDAALKPGGVLIGHSPCNNWINHGFYQICPEMVFGYWQKAMGYDVLEMTLQPLLPNFADQVSTTTNPNDTGERPRITGKPPQNSPIILNYVVRKPVAGAERVRGVYQTDYQRKWQDG